MLVTKQLKHNVVIQALFTMLSHKTKLPLKLNFQQSKQPVKMQAFKKLKLELSIQIPKGLSSGTILRQMPRLIIQLLLQANCNQKLHIILECIVSIKWKPEVKPKIPLGNKAAIMENL